MPPGTGVLFLFVDIRGIAMSNIQSINGVAIYIHFYRGTERERIERKIKNERDGDRYDIYFLTHQSATRLCIILCCVVARSGKLSCITAPALKTAYHLETGVA